MRLIKVGSVFIEMVILFESFNGHYLFGSIFHNQDLKIWKNSKHESFRLSSYLRMGANRRSFRHPSKKLWMFF